QDIGLTLWSASHLAVTGMTSPAGSGNIWEKMRHAQADHAFFCKCCPEYHPARRLHQGRTLALRPPRMETDACRAEMTAHDTRPHRYCSRSKPRHRTPRVADRSAGRAGDGA